VDSSTAEKIRLGDYRTTFGTPSGKRVLEDLLNKFLYQDARLYAQAGNDVGLTYIEGQRQLMVAVLKWATTPEQANMPQFVQPLTQGDPYSA
jgi:hypothetical protein